MGATKKTGEELGGVHGGGKKSACNETRTDVSQQTNINGIFCQFTQIKH